MQRTIAITKLGNTAQSSVIQMDVYTYQLTSVIQMDVHTLCYTQLACRLMCARVEPTTTLTTDFWKRPSTSRQFRSTRCYKQKGKKMPLHMAVRWLRCRTLPHNVPCTATTIWPMPRPFWNQLHVALDTSTAASVGLG